MKIDDLNTITALNTRQTETHSANEVANKRIDNKVKIPQKDRVKLSSRKAELDTLYNTVANMPDVRSDRVAELKQRIDEGSYKVDGVKVAEKMIRHFKGSEDSGGTE